MENASKALIIVGAILLSILIIGLGMYIFKSVEDPLQNAASSMSEQERNIHNQKFTTYQGARRSGSDVRSLIGVLIQNYATQANDGNMGRCPGVSFTPVGGTTSTTVNLGEAVNDEFNDMISLVRVNSFYNVVVNIDAGAGIVNQINITENTL